jgi:Flp pilus assembly protein TadG
MMTAWTKFRSALRAFRAARGGNVAITLALAALPIIGGVGAAIDYSRANFARTKMQAALDTTALMLSREASADTGSQLQSNATKYFLALFNPPEAQNIAINITYSTSGGSNLIANGSATVPTTFAGVLGLKTINISSSSTVRWGNSRLRVALVLDNTGSMAQNGKMDALKTATKNLLSQLNSAAQTNGDVYVSIIPFVKDVNVDPVNYNASWVDWTDWDNINGTCYNNANFNGNPAGYSSKTSCQANGKYWKTANHNTWNGCITDRGNSQTPNAGNYDTNVSLPIIGDPAVLFPAEQYSPCPQAVMGLSYDWPTMNTVVNNMSPGGNTNQAIGLVHGWQSLVGGGPYTAPALDPNYNYSQIIILLTDGLNTQDRWYTSQSSIDARQTLTCNNIKAAGIILYTIQVNTGGSPTSTLLQNCASSSDKFFLLTSAAQIVTTFNSIGTNLTKLYVAK